MQFVHRGFRHWPWSCLHDPQDSAQQVAPLLLPLKMPPNAPQFGSVSFEAGVGRTGCANETRSHRTGSGNALGRKSQLSSMMVVVGSSTNCQQAILARLVADNTLRTLASWNAQQNTERWHRLCRRDTNCGLCMYKHPNRTLPTPTSGHRACVILRAEVVFNRALTTKSRTMFHGRHWKTAAKRFLSR